MGGGLINWGVDRRRKAIPVKFGSWGRLRRDDVTLLCWRGRLGGGFTCIPGGVYPPHCYFGRGSGFVWGIVAESEEVAEGALVHHVEAGFVAVEEG